MTAHVPPPRSTETSPTRSPVAPRLTLGGTTFDVEAATGISAPSDTLLTATCGGSLFTLRVPSGLLAVVLAGEVDLQTLFALPAEDAALVAEHLLGPALTEAERHVGARLAFESLSHEARAGAPDPAAEPDPGDADPTVGTHRFALTRGEATWPAVVEVASRSRLDRVLEGLALQARSRDATPSPSPRAAEDPPAPSGCAVALGPLVLETEHLATMAPGDILGFGQGGTTGAILAAASLIPVEVGSDLVTIAAGFERSALDAPAPAHAKLWIECGSIVPDGETRLVAGTTLAWRPLPDDTAWLTLDGCRLRVARGRLVDAGGQVAFRVEHAGVSAWA